MIKTQELTLTNAHHQLLYLIDSHCQNTNGVCPQLTDLRPKIMALHNVLAATTERMMTELHKAGEVVQAGRMVKRWKVVEKN